MILMAHHLRGELLFWRHLQGTDLCVVMLDLECYDLINEMFRTFFNVISDEHPKGIHASMQTIMFLILDESEEIQEKLLVILLSPLGRKRNEFSMAARKLAMDVIGHCSGKLKSSIRHFLVSSISGDGSSMECFLDYHEVIYDIYQCAPQILSGIVPYMTGELLTDNLDIRQKAVQLLGDLFALPGVSISESFQPLFSEFVKRLTDRVVNVRISVVQYLKNCLVSNTTRPEAPLIIKALSDRLLDYDENVRKQVVAAFCDLACYSINVIPAETARLVADRLRDKSLSVKRYTMERLADLYRSYCLNCTDNSITNDGFEWIPGRILRCLYDKDFRSETIEYVLCGSLLPFDLSIRNRVKHWIKAFSTFDKVETKALEQILMQKQRLQQEFQKYLTLRQTHQDNVSELQKRLSASIRIMSRLFHDATKAEEGFQMLNQLKDLNVWKLLSILLDASTDFSQAWSCREELLKILGERHSLYEFMGMLTVKCSYLLFNKAHVKEMIVEASEQKSFGCDGQYISSCMDLLTVIASFSSQLFVGCQDDLVILLKEDNEIIKEGVARVLSKAGGNIREQLAMTSSSIDLLLERLCLEGTRKQAKYSVHALAAITKDDGLKSLSVLYKRLVDMLEEKRHLPSVLQSLGCIAQIAMPVFETREDEIVEFIVKKVLEHSNETASSHSIYWDERSELCSLKMLGIKTLVKSYLHINDASSRTGIDRILGMLRNILTYGDISNDIHSSAVDKAHMKLTAAKSVLRLSRQWDDKIPLDIFYMTLRITEGAFPQFRKLFISKLHQNIKDRLLDAKYACAFLLNINQYQSPEYKEVKQYLLEVVQICHQLKLRQISMQNDVSSSVMYPESILVYLVHALAHHPSSPNVDECKDLTSFEPIYWRLHLFLSVLLLGDDGWQSGGCLDRRKDSYASVVSIFHTIKCSEDAADITKSRTSHGISDLGLAIAKKLLPDQADNSDVANKVSLPSMLYKSFEKEKESTIDNGEHSWLSSESALAHFEALMFEDKEQIVSDANKDSIILDKNDGDDNEVPLGKMMKLLKSHASKKKKMKTQTSNLEMKNMDEDVDVLGMVREINLDAIEAARGTNKNSPKRKQNETNNINIPTPKRKRSFNIHRSPSYANKKHDASFKEANILLSSLPKLQSISSRDGNNTTERTYGEVLNNDIKKSKVVDLDKKGSGSKSSGNSVKKRKVRRISGLSKCTSLKSELSGEELVGSRIKVWWPLDKRFYEGIVHSYVPETGKHNILYDDGDVEVLRLEKEKWELIPNSFTSKKIPMRQLFSTHLQRSPVVTEKSSKSNSQLNNKPIKRSIGPHMEGKHVSGKISQRFKKISEKDSISNMDDERDLEESNGDPHYESDNVNSDEKAEGNAAERTEELEEMDISSPKSKEYSDNEPLRLWRQRAGKAG
ncbi:hypothetical protein HPP92_006209 [Vanilla planifolia]|uniref:Uncharacterized protein n=1 Tax=Vanilla planifolia TaxID=51239 RepID=A0A835RMU3_VANPL|nr:hypothetical protein HPP92_006209 [Vanilla planifolia]